MANHNPKNQFTKDDNRASEAGKSSSRGPSKETMLQEMMKFDAPKEMVAAIEEKFGIELTKHQNLAVVCAVLIREAFNGNVQAINSILDRVDGKPVTTIELDSKVVVSHEKELEISAEEEARFERELGFLRNDQIIEADALGETSDKGKDETIAEEKLPNSMDGTEAPQDSQE